MVSAFVRFEACLSRLANPASQLPGVIVPETRTLVTVRLGTMVELDHA